MEPRRRDDLVRAAIAEIAACGTADVTVARIARRAGMSPALAHHYFGSKDRMLLAAMRHVLSVYGTAVRDALHQAPTPRARLEAIVRCSFAPANFRDEVVAAWLNFYVQAQRSPDTRRLLQVYHARLRSNLIHALRPLTPDPALLAEGIGAMLDGLYVRQALRADGMTSEASTALVLGYIDRGLGA
ncbi:choline-binding transcriptional repressor BetI [Jannaschia rubra]|uniref:HTH-type transcriptional regulator BetI n=2 Tax=Jannaschia rubra TaxID=282197 RepID=A0A0M6XT85_9RHOB|nr:transcriptional regulator BetI [Jannaschia rubra]CTQ33204.1 transcriptional regulator BetI [Jannaschia rubra]SFF96901.1 transcriptional regulator, TetR family [Jannaschia rubra]